MAPDAGFGGAIYLDGNLLNKKTNDLWFGWNSWNNATILQVTNVVVTASNHVFEGFWAEGCCNGNQFLEYTTDGQNWQSMANLAAPAAVPVPAALWLFSSAFVGILGISRRK